MRPIKPILIIKRLFLILFSLTFLCTVIIAVSIPLAKNIKPSDLMAVENQTAITIDNTQLVTMAAGSDKAVKILKDRQLVIRNGSIVAINPAGTELEKGSKLIDAQGAYSVPGLFDMHVHLYDRKYAVLNLAFGVTSLRVMNGQAMNLRWKHELETNEWLGSNLYVSSPILDGANTNALSQKVLTPEAGRHEVRKAKANGYDFIKIYGYLDAASFEAIVDEANSIGMPAAKHGPTPVAGSDWKWLKGMQSLEHAEDIFQGPLQHQFDYEQLDAVAKTIKSLDVPVVPTLETFNHLARLSNEKQNFIDELEMDYLNPLYRDILGHYSVTRWLQDSKQKSEYHLKEQAFLFDVVKVFHQHNIPMAVGSDAGTMYTLSGIATHNEMSLMKQAGLSDYDVLKAATINAATILGVDKQYGSIEVGKVADLVLVQNNPLADIGLLRDPIAVVKNGQWLSQQKLQALKDTAKNTENYYWSAIKLLENILTRRFT